MINISSKSRPGRTASAWSCLCFIALLSFLTVFPSTTTRASGRARFAIADTFVPVLNTPDFKLVFGGKDGNSLATDRCGQIREIEFIAMPRTVFRIEAVTGIKGSPVYRVTTDDYPYPSRSGYYIDSRLVHTTDIPPAARQRNLPDRKTILANLSSAAGTRYVWGGNRRSGIPEIISLYPPANRLDKKTADSWILRGLDCSGLIYEATGGYTPRNTSSLTGYGAPVPIEGMGAEEIADLVRPLDLIVWKGHVMIVHDRERIIESRLDCAGKEGGVGFRSLKAVLRDLLKSRIPLNDYSAAERTGKKGFVVRRWYPDGRELPRVIEKHLNL